ncbi:MAG: hypothetical protein ACTHJ1_06460 [Bordetella sp.]|uniref:hypothetical protein n=1 Tax=Bordetella sp. TaxID=28081 RepID=UPI003F7C21FD
MKIGNYCAALWLAASFAPCASPAQEPAAQHYVGMAYASAGDTLLYSEEHWITRNARGEQRVVLYRCPNGNPFARKRLHGGIDDPTPDFDFHDRRDGYREGVTGGDGERQVYVQRDRSAPRQAAPLAVPRNAVVDAGFDAYLRGRWNALGEGKGTHIAFLVPSRLDYLHLKIHPRDGQDGGRAVRKFRLSLDAWYGFAAPSIEVVYSKDDHRLLRFAGVSNIRDDRGRTQQVRIEFPADKQYPPPSSAQIERAATEPLVQRCDTSN